MVCDPFHGLLLHGVLLKCRKLETFYLACRKICNATQYTEHNVRNITNIIQSQFVKYAIHAIFQNDDLWNTEYTQFQFVKYAICAKPFIQTAVDLQKCHTVHVFSSHKALSHAKWMSFVVCVWYFYVFDWSWHQIIKDSFNFPNCFTSRTG